MTQQSGRANMPEYSKPSAKNIEDRIRTFCSLCYGLYTGLKESKLQSGNPASFIDKPEDG